MRKYVYIIRANGLYKIGSAENLERRLSQLRTAAPYLERVQTIRCYAHRAIEKELHFIFAHKRVAGEWFSLNDSDLDLIAAIDWASFPAEVAARSELARLCWRIVAILKESPSILETLRKHFATKTRIE